MINRIFIFVLATIVLASCQKQDNLTINLKETGTLSAKITDNTGAALPNVKVRLYEGSISSPFNSVGYNFIYEYKTNSSGLVNFGEVNTGTYTVEVDTVRVAGTLYNSFKPVQVIASANKQVNINVQDFVGKVNLTIVRYFDANSSNNYSAFDGLNILLVPANKFSYSDSLNGYINKAEFVGKTDAQGNFSVTIPSYAYYYIVAYKDDKSVFQVINSYFDVMKDEDYNLYMTLYDSDLSRYYY